MDNVPQENPSQDPVASAPAPAPVAEEAAKGGAFGSIIGIIVIVAVLVLGAFYVWGERLSEQPTVPEDGVRGGDASPAGSMEGSVNVEVSEPMPQ